MAAINADDIPECIFPPWKLLNFGSSFNKFMFEGIN